MQEGVLNVCLQAKDRTSFNLNKENFETNLNAPIERAAETDARKNSASTPLLSHSKSEREIDDF